MRRALDLISALSFFGLGTASLMRAMNGRSAGAVGQLPTRKIDARRVVQRIAEGSGLALPERGLVGKQVDLTDIAGKAALLRKLILSGGKHPSIIQAKNLILSRRCRRPNPATGDGGWCLPEKDFEAETSALFNWVRASIRYTRDPAHTDAFTVAGETIRMRAGDCDDVCVLLGSLLLASGQRVKIRVIRTKDASSFNHVYLLTSPGGDGRKWIALDASVARPAGWEAPGAAMVAQTGQPAGMVAEVRDFDV